MIMKLFLTSLVALAVTGALSKLYDTPSDAPSWFQWLVIGSAGVSIPLFLTTLLMGIWRL